MYLFQKAWLRSIQVLIACAILVGCGNENTTTGNSQVVAHIGPDVVTIQELDNEMRANNIPPERRKDPDVMKKVIGDLVTRKMLARRALTTKLDREPTVLLDLLRSKDVVLAEAATTRAVTARLSAITSADVEKYIQGNPLKFARRQILQVEQLVAPISAALEAVAEMGKTAKSSEEIADLLTRREIAFSRGIGTLNTSDLPEEVASAFRSQGMDGVVFVRAGQNGVFLKVRGQENRPLSGAAAEGVARQLMRTDLAKSEASIAAFTANIEARYAGDYEKIMANK